MNRILSVIVLLLLVSLAYAQLAVDDVHFSPKGGCTEAILTELRNAKSSIHVQAYELTSAKIAEALADASTRGVKVEIILDKKLHNQTGNQLALLHASSKIVIKLDGNKHAKSHSKVIIVDDMAVITGSFNFSADAENDNVENQLVIRSKAIAQKYLDQWQDRWQRHAVDEPGK